jgi:hypothetical protein
MCQPASRWAARVRRQPKDPKLHATYDGKQGKPSGPALAPKAAWPERLRTPLPDRLAEASLTGTATVPVCRKE